MRNIKLVLEYDGTNFCGYQRQVEDRTVQEELERSLSHLTEEDIKLFAAGRTDSGVHALAQVVNFKTDSQFPLETFVRGGNSRLPCDVRIKDAEEVAPDFHARYSAKSRTYRYVITTEQRAIGRYYAWYFWKPLDINPMNEACSQLVGNWDFKSFCQANANTDSYFCDVKFAQWSQHNGEIIFEICANRFLHNMVRILVGTMVEIGSKQKMPKELFDILGTKDRRYASATAPALGLFLVQVEY